MNSANDSPGARAPKVPRIVWVILAIVSLVLAAMVAARVRRTSVAMNYDGRQPIAVRCGQCGREFVMRYEQYKTAVEARRELDGGITCPHCGAGKSVWRSWRDVPSEARIGDMLPPASPPTSAPDSSPPRPVMG